MAQQTLPGYKGIVQALRKDEVDVQPRQQYARLPLLGAGQ